MTQEVPSPRRPRFAVHARLRSFSFAVAGFRYLVVSEHNMWLHLAASVFAIAAGSFLAIDRADWLWIVLAISMVWTAEAFNTAIERLADTVTQERDPRIGVVKDVAAAGVLIAAGGAALIGGLVFFPYVVTLL